MSRTRASSSRDAPGTRPSRGPTPTSYCDDTADDDLPQAPRAAPRSAWSKRPRAPPAGGDEEDGQGRRRPRHDKRRHLHRRNLESYAQSNGAVGEAFLYGYLSELYTSPRHASVDPAYRHAVVGTSCSTTPSTWRSTRSCPRTTRRSSGVSVGRRRGALGCDSSRATCRRPSASEATPFWVWRWMALGAP